MIANANFGSLYAYLKPGRTPGKSQPLLQRLAKQKTVSRGIVAAAKTDLTISSRLERQNLSAIDFERLEGQACQTRLTAIGLIENRHDMFVTEAELEAAPAQRQQSGTDTVVASGFVHPVANGNGQSTKPKGGLITEGSFHRPVVRLIYSTIEQGHVYIYRNKLQPDKNLETEVFPLEGEPLPENVLVRVCSDNELEICYPDGSHSHYIDSNHAAGFRITKLAPYLADIESIAGYFFMKVSGEGELALANRVIPLPRYESQYVKVTFVYGQITIENPDTRETLFQFKQKNQTRLHPKAAAVDLASLSGREIREVSKDGSFGLGGSTLYLARHHYGKTIAIELRAGLIISITDQTTRQPIPLEDLRVTHIYSSQGRRIGFIPVKHHFSQADFRRRTGWLLLDEIRGKTFYHCNGKVPFPQGFTRVFARLENGKILGYHCYHDAQALPNQAPDNPVWFKRLYLNSKRPHLVTPKPDQDFWQQFYATPGARVTHYQVPKNLRTSIGLTGTRYVEQKFARHWQIITNLGNGKLLFSYYKNPTSNPKEKPVATEVWDIPK
ncbi:hypothetical protein A2291_06675 [candidate division WOR-1 bacterium RIFOXYB2_FULL_42_35]|uniref:Uncharacterized protein n=1 Tax=candidate division WOR-1 bacterium RIFOXYC2_FULL_41_25 TaxID=1802586 RepID=A0A1F4TQ08_UNCSA|nr:MAG: hypothetical protein A2291_06675 [candidate division WOR-1 bacterium RIFOXYB2_FULL_42_35]OGC24565.1 MAG: hypothetical protein A2247_06455 [candidate division WOR-1 bacterium RIFOXYA2_FULL_41_14]OGC34610.1 MAG: hypothetical protein A2462_04690 [candidate division WOR-1 bacterium RIFOXYC2_FULL_41_25]OGC43982.1 MAG: hypothetical protein A2548_06270 [candidate division WOR-1 bacterium RIFOXYD2_FULL_41_8]